MDQTTEAELVRALPALVKGTDLGTVRTYSMEISNWPDHGWLINPFIPSSASWHSDLGGCCVKPDLGGCCVKPASRKVAYWLGHRYVLFRMGFVISDGRVSKASYMLVLENATCVTRVGADTLHGRWAGAWAARHLPVPVSSIDDQDPILAVSGDGESLYAIYTFDAPSKAVSHALQLELGCLWSIRGCSSAREAAPALWRHKVAIEAATVSRLRSGNPCPDEMLAGRVRYLPDLNVELLEVISSRSDGIDNYEGDHVWDRIIITDYRLIDAIRGPAGEPRISMAYRNRIPAPLSSAEEIRNPVRPPEKPGDRVLYFSGAKFESCRVVPATPSALAAVRAAVPAPKRSEDEMHPGWGGA